MAAVSVQLVSTALARSKAPSSVAAVPTAVSPVSARRDVDLDVVATSLARPSVDFPVEAVATALYSKAELAAAALEPVAAPAYRMDGRAVSAERLVGTQMASVFAPTPAALFSAAPITFDARAAKARQMVATATKVAAAETPRRFVNSAFRSISSVSLATQSGIYGSTALVGANTYDYRGWDGTQFVYWSSTYADTTNPNPLATLPVAAGPVTGAVIIGVR